MTGMDWSDIRGRLARLAADPSASKVFGANGHGWALEPPLRAEELAELETQLRVELPADYRAFLLEAGRGGAGPFYGLFPVRPADGRWRWEGDGAELTAPATLAEPFPRTEAFNPVSGFPEAPDEDDFDSVEAFEAAEEAFWDLYEAENGRSEHTVGLLYLCHLGCAHREMLVVSGPARGQMWADYTADDGGFRPLSDQDGKPLGFTRWYRRWLDEAEQISR